MLSERNHSPLPLWIAGLFIGLLSAFLLKASLVQVLNRLMDIFTNLIYVKLFHMSAQFPVYYIPAAGIAAGTIVTACFTPACRKVGFAPVVLPSMILIPVLTAVLAPLVDFAGTILVLVLVFAAFAMRDIIDVPVRSGVPFVLMALGVGVLSGLYFYANGLVVIGDNKNLTIVGGIVSGITIASLGCKSYRCEKSRFRALFFLALIPFCTPGFSSGIAYIISLAGAFFILVFCQPLVEPPQHEKGANMWGPDGNPVYDRGNGNISFSENMQTVDAEYSPSSGTFYTMDGREYERRGNNLCRVR